MDVMIVVGAIGVVVVGPVLILLIRQVLAPLATIRRAAARIGTDGTTVAADLEPVPALLETKKLVGDVKVAAVRYLDAIEPLL